VSVPLRAGDTLLLPSEGILLPAVNRPVRLGTVTNFRTMVWLWLVPKTRWHLWNSAQTFHNRWNLGVRMAGANTYVAAVTGQVEEVSSRWDPKRVTKNKISRLRLRVGMWKYWRKEESGQIRWLQKIVVSQTRWPAWNYGRDGKLVVRLVRNLQRQKGFHCPKWEFTNHAGSLNPKTIWSH